MLYGVHSNLGVASTGVASSGIVPPRGEGLPGLVGALRGVSHSPQALPAGDRPPSRLEANRQTETHLADYAAQHPAAQQTMKALLDQSVELFMRVRGELNGWSELIRAVSPTQDSNRGGSGVIGPRYETVGSVGWNGPAIREACRNGSFREQGTLYFSILMSQEFHDLMRDIAQNPALQERVADIVDLAYLGQKMGASGLELYRLAGWAAKQTESREARRGGAKFAMETAGDLLAKGELTARELRYHQTHPANQAGAQARVGFDQQPLEPANVRVDRGYGKLVWSVKADSEFAQKAQTVDKPTVAGPSGTTFRFLTGARLLSVGSKEALGVPDERAFLELVRFAAYGYLVRDQHHSFLEVNLGAAAHGLAEQWDADLYQKLFSQPVQGKGLFVET